MIRMRKNNVLIRQVQKAQGEKKLYLPENVDQKNKALFDLVVEDVGPEVNKSDDQKLKKGDKVVILYLDPARHFIPDPNGDGVLAVVQDDMIQGVFK